MRQSSPASSSLPTALPPAALLCEAIKSCFLKPPHPPTPASLAVGLPHPLLRASRVPLLALAPSPFFLFQAHPTAPRGPSSCTCPHRPIRAYTSGHHHPTHGPPRALRRVAPVCCLTSPPPFVYCPQARLLYQVPLDHLTLLTVPLPFCQLLAMHLACCPAVPSLFPVPFSAAICLPASRRLPSPALPSPPRLYVLSRLFRNFSRVMRIRPTPSTLHACSSGSLQPPESTGAAGAAAGNGTSRTSAAGASSM